MTLDEAAALVPEGYEWLVRTDEEKGGFANVHEKGDPLTARMFKAYGLDPADALRVAVMLARGRV